MRFDFALLPEDLDEHFAKVNFNVRSRDDIPKLIMGLKYIYENEDLRKEVFDLIRSKFTERQLNFGRVGLPLWSILVLSVCKTNLDYDYDRLEFFANDLGSFRNLLALKDGKRISLQTIKDNVSLLTPDIMNSINTLIVTHGIELKKKKLFKI